MSRWRRFLRGLQDPAAAPRSEDPRQRPRWFFPGLTARPWHDPAEHAWTRRLEARAEEITREAERSFDVLSATPHDMSEVLAAGRWNAVVLLRGQRMPAAERFPVTLRAVSRIPGVRTAGQVYLSVLPPRSRVAAHCGPTNTRLRCHLGLIVPDGCSLTLAGERRSWRAGHCSLFDDSFEHVAENRSDEWRVVLSIDVWHPDLTRSERAHLAELFRAEREAPRWAEVGAARAFSSPG
jgi:aspartate beta-hydroxylase